MRACAQRACASRPAPRVKSVAFRARACPQDEEDEQDEEGVDEALAGEAEAEADDEPDESGEEGLPLDAARAHQAPHVDGAARARRARQARRARGTVRPAARLQRLPSSSLPRGSHAAATPRRARLGGRPPTAHSATGGDGGGEARAARAADVDRAEDSEEEDEAEEEDAPAKRSRFAPKKRRFAR